MALIKCPECNGMVSDKAAACPHCGCPVEEPTSSIGVTRDKNVSVSAKQYSLELLDHGGKKVQIATILKNVLNVSATEGLSLLSNLPNYILDNVSASTVSLVLQKIDLLPVEYNLYLNGELKIHKEAEITAYPTSNTSFKTIKCPQCGVIIAETSRKCQACGFDKIATHLLQRENSQITAKKNEPTNKEVLEDQPKHTPKCPTCGSTSLDKINAFDRGIAFGLFGGISKTARSQYRCKKCGYMW